MKSIRMRYSVFAAAAVLITAVIVSVIAQLDLGSVRTENLNEIMTMTCIKESSALDEKLVSAENSVKAAADYASGKYAAGADISAYMGDISAVLESLGEGCGASAVYVCVNDTAAGSDKLILSSRESTAKNLTGSLSSDFDSFYSEDDEAHWSAPHKSSYSAADVISFTAPVYLGRKVIGSVGMDMSFTDISDFLSGISFGSDGTAFLTDGEYNVICCTSSNSYRAEIFSASFSGREDLSENGTLYTAGNGKSGVTYAIGRISGKMKLVLCISASEAGADHSKPLAFRWITLLIAMFSAAAAVFAAVLTDRHVIAPLRQMNDAARHMTDGDYNVQIAWRSGDELGLLSDTFRKMRDSLKKNSIQINDLAFKDALTGVGNATAYREETVKVNLKIRKGIPKFTVIVFDVNNLKKINDGYGHNFGDILISSASRIIRETFEPNKIFRIGGDEFCVILEDSNAPLYKELLNQFEKNIEKFNSSAIARLPVSIAYGYSEFNSSDDDNYMSVFRRADNAMYKNKEEMKKEMGDKLPEKKHTDLFKPI